MGRGTDQDLFQNFLVQYNDSGKPSYSHHAFAYVDDFANAADFSTFPTTEWENAKRKFGELMADYEKLRNKRSGIHGSFAETMAEDMKTSSTHTYPLMLYLHGFLEMDQSLLDTCLSYLPSDVFSRSTSRMPRSEPKNKSGGRYQRPGGKGGKSSTENGMQSQVLASLSTKNNVLAHAAAAEAGASTMNNKQHQRDRKRNLMNEFVDEIRRGSFGKAEAKERIKKYKKKN